jgi:hypothetical protein
MPTDPVEVIAQVRHENGLMRRGKQRREYKESHPLRGVAHGYKVWYRHDQLERAAEGREVSVCKTSILLAYPNAIADEIVAFLYNQTGRLYPNSSIYRRMKELRISMKKASIDVRYNFVYGHSGMVCLVLVLLAFQGRN